MRCAQEYEEAKAKQITDRKGVIVSRSALMYPEICSMYIYAVIRFPRALCTQSMKVKVFAIIGKD